jgi:hypothetical protein
MTGQKNKKTTPQRPAAPMLNPSPAPMPDPSPPPGTLQNTTDHADQQATITNTIVTAGNAITDVVSGSDPAVDGATNTDDARTTVDAAINIVNTAIDKRSKDGDKKDKESRADASNDARKATAADLTVPNTTGNGDIELTNTTHTAAMGNTFIATAASLTDAVLPKNAIHAIINPCKTPTPIDTDLVSKGKPKSASVEGAVDALVEVGVLMCTFFFSTALSLSDNKLFST